MKEDNPGWHKADPVERFYIKYDPKNNLSAREYIIPNQGKKEVKTLASDVYVTNDANQTHTPSHKELV